MEREAGGVCVVDVRQSRVASSLGAAMAMTAKVMRRKSLWNMVEWMVTLVEWLCWVWCVDEIVFGEESRWGGEGK